MFYVFVVFQTWKQSRCPTVNEWIRQLFQENGVCYSEINRVVSQVTKSPVFLYALLTESQFEII